MCLSQIDLRFEARNIERFQENFRDVDNIKFPTPLRPFVTRNILVETFEVSAWSRIISDACGIIKKNDDFYFVGERAYFQLPELRHSSGGEAEDSQDGSRHFVKNGEITLMSL